MKTNYMKTNFKKISTLLAVAFSMGSYETNAQTDKGFYVSANIGYNKGTASANLLHAMYLGSVNTTETSPTTSQSKVVSLTIGDGSNFGANFGYMFNKNLGLELGANYLLGSTTNGSWTSYTGNNSNSETSAKMLQIKPTIVFRAGYEKINPYAKIGMVIGSGKITNNQNRTSGVDVFRETLELSGGTPIGFNGNLGVLYKLNNKISLFGELNLTSLEYAPKKGITTVSTKNGIDQLPLMTVREKEGEFVDSITETGLPDNPNEPNKVIKIPFSLNNFGLNIGLQYQF